jgi:hypothetical protein
MIIRGCHYYLDRGQGETGLSLVLQPPNVIGDWHWVATKMDEGNRATGQQDK